MRARNTSRERGLTLVELMVVVAVIGILAALGGVGYARYVRSSKMSEAIYMVNAIRAAEEHHYADQLSYLDLSNTIDSTYPSSTPNDRKTAWGGPCVNCRPNVDWRTLGIDAAPVMFGYAVVAGTDLCDAACRGVTLPPGTPANAFTNKHWYAVKARGDTDANGVFCEVYGYSTSPNLLILNEGE